ncbi:unnamed protein product [Amoebophrya sp. A120]|nr:unnamed protein product [Amoebophrya sp. A120]|eukprot:GSA120T00000673001.1
MAAALRSIGSAFAAQTQPGSAGYSLAFGAACGIGLSGLVAAGRAGYVLFLDHDYYKLQSRQRYLDKQTIFFQGLQEENEAHRLAALAQEFDPVACRAPFSAVEKQYRF